MYLIKTDSLGQSCNYNNAATIVNPTAIQIGTPPTITSSPNTIENVPTLIVRSGSEITSLCPDGISENENLIQVDIYPNPSSGIFNVVLPDFYQTEILITVSSMFGQELLRMNSTSAETHVNLENIPPGIYLLRVLEGSKSFSRKIIVN